jgi:hypothetical protein
MTTSPTFTVLGSDLASRATNGYLGASRLSDVTPGRPSIASARPGSGSPMMLTIVVDPASPTCTFKP